MSIETNDQRILELKKQIETKKEQLGKSIKFSPETNLSIEFEGARSNLNVLSKEQLFMLMVRLNMYRMSATDLKLSTFEIGGYPVTSWINDIKARIEILSRKDEERNLKVMEDKLTQLLSEGTKVKMELDSIESMLKD